MSNVLELKKKRYEVSTEVEEVAVGVVDAKQLNIEPAQVKYVLVYPGINKTTAARCMATNPMIKLFGDCDYIIQVAGDLWDDLDEDRKKILMWHELMHILPIQNPKSGEWSFKLREHDIMDFNVIIKQHGVEWFSELKTLFSSVYDLEPNDLEGFHL